jgi:hypothetical protein
MSFRPSRIIRPSAKLHADNVGQLEVTSHRRAVASAQVAQCGSNSTLLSSPSILSSPSLPPTELPDDPTSDDAPAQAPTPDLATAISHKQPLASRHSTLSVLSLSTSVSNPSLDDSDSADGTTNSKRQKTNAHGSTDALSIPIDVQIIDIDDVEDPRDERLNKVTPTADLKEFFTTLARVLHQPKVRAKCNLCE